MPEPALRRLTVDEYFAIEDTADLKSEFYDGEMFAMVVATRAHNLIAGNTFFAVKANLAGKPCEVYTSDMRVKSPTGLYTYPDVVTTCSKPEFETDKEVTLLNPQVIIEVLSPSTEAYDRGRKFRHYQKIESLREYILIAQDQPAVDQFVLNERLGKWVLTSLTELTDVLALPSLDTEIPLSDIYAQVEFPPEPLADDVDRAGNRE